jgi:GDP-4-dehydro-6-deoxy-D-mannose reductase
VPGLPLITGATGFAGSHLVDHLLEHGPAVAAWSNRSGRAVTTVDPRVTWQAVDMLDGAAVASALAVLQPSVVYHCAGAADVGDSWINPHRALSVNVLGSHHLLEGLARLGLASPVVIIGSATVYRSSLEPIDESHPIGPSSPYGVSKVAQEMLALQAAAEHVLLARPFNHAGPRQASAYVTSSFARQIAEIEAGWHRPILHVGNLDACRDITDVRDTVRAYRLLVERGQYGRPYNICSGRAYRIGDLLEMLVGLSRVPIEIAVDPDRLRPSDTPTILGDSSRLAAETGWTAEIPIERTLHDLLDYWRTQTVRPPSALP